MIAFAAMIVSDKIYKSADMTGNVLEDNSIPKYAGKATVPINGNKPFWSAAEYTTESFEDYSELDKMGRCGVSYANICIELMLIEEKVEIGIIKPTGWHTIKYPEVIEESYLYNRCHLLVLCN